MYVYIYIHYICHGLCHGSHLTIYIFYIYILYIYIYYEVLYVCIFLDLIHFFTPKVVLTSVYLKKYN